MMLNKNTKDRVHSPDGWFPLHCHWRLSRTLITTIVILILPRFYNEADSFWHCHGDFPEDTLPPFLVTVAVRVSWGQDASVRISLQTEGLQPSVTHGWAAQPEYGRSTAMVRRTWDQYVAVSTCLQLTLHTQPTSNLSNKVWEVYFYKDVCSFVHWSSSLLLKMFPLIFIYLYLYIYCVAECGYTT